MESNTETRTALMAAAETAAMKVLSGRRYSDLSVGEWDHVLSNVDKAIRLHDELAREGAPVGGYLYGPQSREKFQGYRQKALRRQAAQERAEGRVRDLVVA